MPPKENLEPFRPTPRRAETRNYSMPPSLESRPFKISRRLRELSAARKSSSSSSTTSSLRPIKLLMRSWSTNSFSKRPRDNTK